MRGKNTMVESNEENIVLHIEVQDEDGNRFPATIAMSLEELQSKLDSLGYKITKKR